MFSAGKWIWPLLAVTGFICVLSLRQLSDPDLGFHLEYGRRVVQDLKVPVTDQTTYTVGNHTYTDLHWLFQVLLYGTWKLAGYTGISLLVCLLSLALAGITLLRVRLAGLSPPVWPAALLILFLITEPRITSRPEMFTFLFLSLFLLVLEEYTRRGRDLLFILPLTAIAWCNMHALFILGPVVMAAFLLQGWIKEKRPDRKLLAWAGATLLACLANPYGWNAFALPWELLTRFEPGNIYHEHIREFIPFFSQDHFVIRDYLFLALMPFSIIAAAFRRECNRVASLLLLTGFACLGLASVRNIPLFALVAIPLPGAFNSFRQKIPAHRWVSGTLFAAGIAIPVLLSISLISGRFYPANNSSARFGTGPDRHSQPIGAASFLAGHQKQGRILNSIGFGGWLSWQLRQPVFIDGRLEVMQEPLYEEIVASWNDSLRYLTEKYKTDLIVFNYLKYYPWTIQLRDMTQFRLVYIDGLAAVFARRGFAPQVGALSRTEVSEHLKSGMYPDPSDSLHVSRFLALWDLPSGDANRDDEAILHFNRGNAEASKGHVKEALAEYDQAIAISSGYARALNNRAILKASAFHDYPGALADFDSAIASDPLYAEAFLGRGTTHLLLGQKEAACCDWSKARKLGSMQATALLRKHCYGKK